MKIFGKVHKDLENMNKFKHTDTQIQVFIYLFIYFSGIYFYKAKSEPIVVYNRKLLSNLSYIHPVE